MSEGLLASVQNQPFPEDDDPFARIIAEEFGDAAADTVMQTAVPREGLIPFAAQLMVEHTFGEYSAHHREPTEVYSPRTQEPVYTGAPPDDPNSPNHPDSWNGDDYRKETD
jgi:hypothetical protein